MQQWDCSSVAERARDSESTPGVAPAIRCVATLSTASVTQAHESGVLFAAMPRSDLLLSTGSDGCLKAWTVAGLTKDSTYFDYDFVLLLLFNNFKIISQPYRMLHLLLVVINRMKAIQSTLLLLLFLFVATAK